MVIKRISWDIIYPIWKDRLWKNRVSKIKPTNGLGFLSGYDKTIEDNIPTFFGAYKKEKCVGVISGHSTSAIEYRSRGIYVFPECRKRGIAQKLFQSIEEQAVQEDRTILWSMPRKKAISTYLKFGFEIASLYFCDMEFGPNCFVVKYLNKYQKGK